MPAALAPFAQQPRWVVWRYVPRKRGKPAKVPCHPLTGELFEGVALAPGMGSTYAEAVAALAQSRRWHGLGIILGEGLAGVDFDHCISAGVIAPRVANDVAALGSYAELSPSGEGVKVFAVGELPTCWKTDYCEAYDHGRFFTVTGRQVEGTPDEVRPAQGALDALAALWAPRGGRRGSETPRAAGEPALSPLALAPAGFWEQVAYWEQHRARLLRLDGLPFSMSPQLRALVERGELPAALAAKGTSASERRALVVRQLRRRGYGHTDAEAYVIARSLWHKLGIDTKSERDLQADALRLILVENPLALEDCHPRSQERAQDCDENPTKPYILPPASAPASAPPRRAPASAEAYLAALTAAAVGGVVLEGRRERAELAGVHEKTAQRREAELEKAGAIVVKKVRTASGKSTVVQILNRINEAILAPEQPPDEDVHTPPLQRIREPETAPETPVCIEDMTRGVLGAPAFDVLAWHRRCAAAPLPPLAPRRPPDHTPVFLSSDVPAAGPLVVRARRFEPAKVPNFDALALVKRERRLALAPPQLLPERQPQQRGFVWPADPELAALLGPGSD